MKAIRCALLTLPILSLSSLSAEDSAARVDKLGQRGGMMMHFADCTSAQQSCQESTFFKGSYALIISVGAYEAGWSRLSGVHDDAEAVQKMLEGQGFETQRLTDPDIRQLREGLQRFIDQFGRDSQNRLLIYFAGHGATLRNESDIQTGYIIPVDAPDPEKDRKGFYAHAMSMDNVMLLAKEIQSRHALFIFDSCFSGTLFLSRSKPKLSPVINYKLALPVRQFITAGSENESVPDRSVFRQRLVEGLEGRADANGDSYVTGTELGEFLMASVLASSNGTQHPQYGKINEPKLSQGDFVFSVKGRTASLYLNSFPESVVRVDDQLIEGFPVFELFVGPGQHTVTFRAGDQPPLVKMITISVGDVVRCLADFDRREVECRTER